MRSKSNSLCVEASIFLSMVARMASSVAMEQLSLLARSLNQLGENREAFCANPPNSA
jgi:hypothetical protein